MSFSVFLRSKVRKEIGNSTSSRVKVLPVLPGRMNKWMLGCVDVLVSIYHIGDLRDLNRLLSWSFDLVDMGMYASLSLSLSLSFFFFFFFFFFTN